MTQKNITDEMKETLAGYLSSLEKETKKSSGAQVFVFNTGNNMIRINVLATDEYLEKYPKEGSLMEVLHTVDFGFNGTEQGSEPYRKGFTAVTFDQFKGLVMNPAFAKLVEEGRLRIHEKLPSGVSSSDDMTALVNKNKTLQREIKALEEERDALLEQLDEKDKKIADLEELTKPVENPSLKNSEKSRKPDF